MNRDNGVTVRRGGPLLAQGTVLSRKPIWIRILVWVALGLAFVDLLLRFAVTGERLSGDTGNAQFLWLGVTAVAFTGMLKYDEEVFTPAVIDVLFYASLAAVLGAATLRVSTLIAAVSR